MLNLDNIQAKHLVIIGIMLDIEAKNLTPTQLKKGHISRELDTHLLHSQYVDKCRTITEFAGIENVDEVIKFSTLSWGIPMILKSLCKWNIVDKHPGEKTYLPATYKLSKEAKKIFALSQ